MQGHYLFSKKNPNLPGVVQNEWSPAEASPSSAHPGWDGGYRAGIGPGRRGHQLHALTETRARGEETISLHAPEGSGKEFILEFLSAADW